MAKKSKTVDLKPKADKISDEQLKKVQEVINNINKFQIEVGMLETKKHSMLHHVAGLQEQLTVIQVEFEKEYGTADINIQDGTINYKDEQTDKKD
jgi:FtsZ-binding cell division protein ZapB